MSGLHVKSCVACEGGAVLLDASEQNKLLGDIHEHWSIEDGYLTSCIQFNNYYETVAFVNAIAWISHQENHHADLLVRYSDCTIRYQTHAVKGLTENDFICAAKIDQLIAAGLED